MKAVVLLGALFAVSARAGEPDPRVEMARALEAQADVAPAPPALPEQAAIPAPRGAINAARVAAIRAAAAEIARAAAATLPANAAPAAQTAVERAHGRASAQPGTRRH
jgi:hypothetical protein